MSNNLPVPANGGDSIESIMALADRLQHAEGMVPKQYLRQPDKILAAVLTGRELGIEPMASMRSLHIVEGKPVADYSFWIARMLRAGYKVEWLESTDKQAKIKLTRRDGATHVETYTYAMAQRAGLTGKNNWKSYPEAMLKARATTAAGRAFAADVMFGCYELDEAEEIRAAEFTVQPAEKPKLADHVAQLADRVAPAVVETTPAKQEEPAPADAPVQLDCATIVAGMREAQTDEELQQWAGQAKGLTGQDKAEARVAYAEARRRIADLLADNNDRAEDAARKAE